MHVPTGAAAPDCREVGGKLSQVVSSTFKCPLGWVRISEESGAVTRLELLGMGEVPVDQEPARDTPLLRDAEAQLHQYLAGERTRFEVPLAPAGTPFQQAVWEELQRIPYGETRTYGQIAAAVGNPKACRAVGMANNRNPIGIMIPCHRVVGSNGSLVGYATGLDHKRQLLDIEAGSSQPM